MAESLRREGTGLGGRPAAYVSRPRQSARSGCSGSQAPSVEGRSIPGEPVYLVWGVAVQGTKKPVGISLHCAQRGCGVS